MNEALAATQEEVLGTEEVVAADNEAPEASQENEQEAADAPLDSGTSGEKKPSGFQRRMAKFEAALEELMEERDYWKKEATKRQPEPVQAKSRLDFNTDEEWIEHRLQTERETLVREAQEAAAKTVETKQVIQGYQAKVNEVKKDYADWDSVFANAQEEGLTLPENAVEFCLESDVGPRIAYHLAKNPDEYDKFIAMSPARQMAYLGKLEDRVAKPTQPVVKKVTQAPAKLTEVKGGAAKTTPTGVDRFASKQAWREWRASQGKR